MNRRTPHERPGEIVEFPVEHPDLELHLETLGRRLRHGSVAPDLQLGALLPRPPLWFRVIVAVLALAQTVVVIPWFLGSDPGGLLEGSGADHLTRDGAIGLVVSVAAILAAWRPHWAMPSFAVASIAVIAQAVAAVVEESSDGLGAGELIHLPSVVLTCLIGLSGIRLRALGPSTRDGGDPPPGRRR